jgi:anti-sigma factor RsiW
MQNDKWTTRLSEYIDGELSPSESEALEAHLLECADCGRTLHELRAVVARAGNVLDRPPENDLWQGISARIAQTGSDVGVEKRRFSFSISQLVAAGVVLMLLSGGTMYMYMARTAIEQVATQSAAPAGAQGPVTTDQAVARPVTVESPAAANYNVAINELEKALRDGRSRLDTATVRVLESNLRTIDNAITEARAALGRDPGNPYLNRYLDETVKKKIQLLRRATGILRAQT